MTTKDSYYHNTYPLSLSGVPVQLSILFVCWSFPSMIAQACRSFGAVHIPTFYYSTFAFQSTVMTFDAEGSKMTRTKLRVGANPSNGKACVLFCRSFAAQPGSLVHLMTVRVDICTDTLESRFIHCFCSSMRHRGAQPFGDVEN